MRRKFRIFLCAFLFILIQFFFQVSKVQAKEVLQTPQLISVLPSGDEQVVLKWAQVSAADGYRIFRRENNGKWKTLYTIKTNKTIFYKDSGLDGSTRYYYTVRAYQRKDGDIIWSGYDHYGLVVIPRFSEIYPWKFTQEAFQLYKPALSTLKEVDKTSLLLTWKGIGGVDAYRIFRRKPGEPWKGLKNLYGGSNYYYLDTNLEAGVKYEYTVRAYKKINGNYIGTSYQALGISAVAGKETVEKLKTIIPKFSAQEDGGKIKIQWEQVENADGYRIFRKEPNSSWKSIKTVKDESVTSWIDQTVVSGRKYIYIVRAFCYYGDTVQWSSYNSSGVALIVNESSIHLSSEFLIIGKGKTYTFSLDGTDMAPKWSSSNKKIVTVSQDGKISGVKAGSALVFAELFGKKYSASILVIESEPNRSLKITQKHYTKNSCLLTKNTCKKIGIQVHSIGYGQSSADILYTFMNNLSYQAGVHYLVDATTPGKVYQTMPDEIAAWADGGFGNRNLITMEICESNYMKYVGASAIFTVTDSEKFLQDIKRGYDTAVQLCAYLCKKYDWNPTARLSNGLYLISSHYEGNLAGTATAHVDPDHVWAKCGYSMDGFRADVKIAMSRM